MDLAELREQVCEANLGLVRAGLVTLSFGNASGVDRDTGALVIKPSGVAYDRLRPSEMVVVNLADGAVREGTYRPSSDTPTHLALYRRYPSIGGIVHTHSAAASAWAQARRAIPCLGTTHADYFDGPVPVTRDMTPEEIGGDYEANTGSVIVEWFAEQGLDPAAIPGVLVASHGPFTWGRTLPEAVEAAIALEAIAARALDTLRIAPDAAPISTALLRRHHDRKHGPRAYYGQPSHPPRIG